MKQLDNFKAWFLAREPRERLTLAAGAVAVALTLLFLLVIEPMTSYRAALESRVAQQRETVAWMQAAAAELKSRPAASLPSNTSGSLLTRIDAAAKAGGLGSAVKRIQQDGNRAARVRVEGAVFDDLVLWLEALQSQYGVRAADITLERGEAPGRVNASLTLAEAEA